MGDRLAEIEGLRDALYDIPDDISVPVSAGLARDFLRVYQRADSAAGFDAVDGVRYCRACDYAEALCKCKPRIHGLRAALANLEGGA